ncbi:alanine racemase [Bacteroidota bacterium]
MKINSPTFLIEKSKCLKNIQKMAAKARANNLIFRPHFKTHQLAEIGEWFRQERIDKITVSSVAMAKYFADQGWNDITIAFPLNILELNQIEQLANKIKLSVLIDSVEVASFLRDNIKAYLNFFIEIDAGYNRTGIKVNDKKKIDTVLSKLAENYKVTFEGFIIHSGNTYLASSIDEILSIHKKTISQLYDLKNHYSKYYKELKLSIGDTPSCSLADSFENINEIRPGNFVFYDWMQYKLGSCSFDEIAVAMVCPVVGIYPERNEIAIHGGAAHFSKEYLVNDDGTKSFGQVCQKIPYFEKMESFKIAENCYLSSISQEHGIVKCTDEFLKQVKIGELISIIPIHSCLTMNLMKNNYLISFR